MLHCNSERNWDSKRCLPKHNQIIKRKETFVKHKGMRIELLCNISTMNCWPISTQMKIRFNKNGNKMFTYTIEIS